MAKKIYGYMLPSDGSRGYLFKIANLTTFDDAKQEAKAEKAVLLFVIGENEHEAIDKISAGDVETDEAGIKLALQRMKGGKYVKGPLTMNPSLTFGNLPPYDEFEAAYDKRGTTGPFVISHPATRAGKHSEAIVPSGDYECDELYLLLKRLTFEWMKGDEEAGEWASSILSVLGFEWV